MSNTNKRDAFIGKTIQAISIASGQVDPNNPYLYMLTLSQILGVLYDAGYKQGMDDVIVDKTINKIVKDGEEGI